MNEKALKTLEFNKIIYKIESRAISSLGKEEVKKIKPLKDMSQIKQAQQNTTEAVAVILRKGSLPLGGIKNINESIKRVAVAGTLSIEELMHIADFLYVCQKINIYSREDSKNTSFGNLQAKFDVILNCTKLREEINRCIISSTEVADGASKDLFNIRRSIKETNSKVKEQLNSMIHSQQYKTMVQESVITIRNGRYCIPIKQEYQNAFKGMIHDQSSTGATVFIEPLVSVQLNNKIKELILEEKKEIEKVLIMLSGIVAENIDSLKENSRALTELDVIFAKGEYSIEIFGTEPIFNNKGYINIKKGRHPLLDAAKVVPTNIYIGKEFNMLLITGPNTGGKTVALKTVGLFTLMGQAGLHIPATDKSELSVFDDVFSDIGDEQSIEQSLSTFSSHMSNIVSILEKTTDNSLILLDELGAGTDPTEGAALAIAILEYLRDREIRTIVTTHYSELKVFALSTKKVINACCEFNVETLRPSYNLLIGIPGKSNAFAISQKLGLPEFIINSAKEVLTTENERFEDIITDLEISKRTVVIEQEKAEQYRKEAVILKNNLETKKEEMLNQKNKIIDQAKDEARKIILEAKNDSDRLMKQFNKQLKDSSSARVLEDTKREIKNKLTNAEQLMSKTLDTNKKLEPIIKKLERGDKVYINSLSQNGTVVSVPDASGNLMVQAGILKAKVNVRDLSVDQSFVKSIKTVYRYSHTSKDIKSRTMTSEIDLRGLMVDEAIQKTDKFLDDAALSNLEQITIIHGKGTGALRTGLHKYFKKHPHVKGFRSGEFGEGDSGVTVIQIR